MQKLNIKVSFDMCFVIDGSDEKTSYTHVIYNLTKNGKEYVFRDNESVKRFIYDFDLQIMTFINSANDENSFNFMHDDNFEKGSTNSKINYSGENDSVSKHAVPSTKQKFLGKFYLTLCKQFLITDEVTGRCSLFLKNNVYNKNQHLPLLLTKWSDSHSNVNLKFASVSEIKTAPIGKNTLYEDFYKSSIVTVLNSRENLEIIDFQLSPLFSLLQKKINNKDIKNISDWYKEVRLAQRSLSINDSLPETLDSGFTKIASQVETSGSIPENPKITKSTKNNGKQILFIFKLVLR